MAEENKDQKTEEATSKRRRETEEKGQFAVSRELNSTFILLFTVFAFVATGQQTALKIMATWRWILTQSHAIDFNIEGSLLLLKWIMVQIATIIGPILIMIMLGGLISNLIQTRGLKFSLHPLQPNFNKLNPMKGFSRIFSKNSISELLKSLFKVGVLSMIGYMTIKNRLYQLPMMMELGVGQILMVMGEVMLEIMIKALLFMVILAVVDYAFQMYQHQEGIRMTKQEVKDERKETEGDPIVKQRVRNVQLQMARNRMMAAVPEADVIVTNPTHISIALKYDRRQHEAPVVVAKGADNLAQKIREIAKANDVPLVEDKPLARTLYKTVDVGQIIPASLFKAIAEILAHVYRLKQRRMV